MKILTKITLALILSVAFTLSTDLLAHGSRLSIPNVRIIDANLMTGGQPEQSDFEKMKHKGVEVVINLREKGEFKRYDEAAEAKKQGLTYYSLEVSSVDGITRENAIKLDKLLNKKRTLVHCDDGNRAGALLALREYFVKGKPVKVAIAYGGQAGLTSLSSKVEKVLKQAESEKLK
jgi:protein tyrosine phosphatase (PTP) superfamily phosphohydrolase (DUF442 family)